MAIDGPRESYSGMVMKQKAGVLKVFNKFFEDEKFDTIIEIGTGNGAFSLYITEKAREMGAEFYTFDVKDIHPEVKRAIYTLGGVFKREDATTSDLIERLMKRGRVLVLNDGGLKVPLFSKLAKVLKVGDCLLTHDYYEGKTKIHGGTVTLGEIAPDMSANRLTIRYGKMFTPFLWICCMREYKGWL
jgi:hypothetical protein